MDIEFGMPVVDKNNKAIGTIGKIFMDTWTGKPRKYMVRQDVPGAPDDVYIIPPGQVGEVTDGKVKLNVAVEELGQA
jgi:sporulation protein YlmC with PRC-barrel domain